MHDRILLYPDLTQNTLTVLRKHGILTLDKLIRSYPNLKFLRGISDIRMNEINEFLKKRK